MTDDPRRAALASLFIVERSGNLYALRVRDQATGGWALRPDERVECPVSMLEARMLALRDGLVDAALAALDAAAPAGAAAPEPGAKVRALAALAIRAARYRHPSEALWAGLLDLGLARLIDADGNPIDATDDPDPDMEMTEEAKHFIDALDSGAPVEPEPGAVLAGVVRAEDHERIKTERDAARADAAGLRKELALIQDAPGKVERLTERVALLEATVADYEREARSRSPDGRKAAQLALFAAAEADPAGEAQHAAASGAAVSALGGAAADAPAPEGKPRRTVTCGKCGLTGHNARGCHPEAT